MEHNVVKLLLTRYSSIRWANGSEMPSLVKMLPLDVARTITDTDNDHERQTETETVKKIGSRLTVTVTATATIVS